MSENKNNQLNEFNRRSIEMRNARVRRRMMQKIAVLVAFVLLVALLVASLWLIILDIKDNISENNPNETGNNINTPSATTPAETPEVTTTEGVTTPEVTTPEITPPLVTEPAFELTSKNYTQQQIHEGNLILVNQDHPFVPPSDMDAKLDTVSAFKPTDSKSLYFQAVYVKLLPTVSSQLYKMTDANFAETKINDLCVSANGAYRTYEEQQKLFDSNAAALPGDCSDFNTGLAVHLIGWTDDNKLYEFDNSKYESGKVFIEWFNNNAYKYGFVQRFTADKVSITGQAEFNGLYRYVGYIHAYNMKENKLCLEEYINTIARYTFDGEHYNVTADDGHRYEIYYVASKGETTAVPVPKNLPYEVSGDNIGGYIVTVTLD